MENSLKYDPLYTHRNGNAKLVAIEKLWSVKIETDLEYKLQTLTKKLVAEEDDDLLFQISSEIKNTLKDIEDLKRTRHLNTLKSSDVYLPRTPEFIKINIEA